MVSLGAGLTGCDALSSLLGGDEAKESADDDDGDRKSSASEDSAKLSEEDSPLLKGSFFGDEAAFDGVAAIGDEFKGSLGAAPHSPVEPDFFDAGWIGREAHDVLQRAIKKEFVHRGLRASDGRSCLVFHANGLVRRMLIGTGQKGTQLEEMTFTREGRLVLWYRNNNHNTTPTTRQWGYFHRGQAMHLYQFQATNEARQNLAAPEGLVQHIVAASNDCLTRSGATNPLASVGAPLPAPAPAVVQPEAPSQGGGPSPEPAIARVFGAIATSPTHHRWGVSVQRVSDAEAAQEAIKFCGRSDCQVKMTAGPGECISVAHGAGNWFAWGRASNLAGAQSRVQEECVKASQQCSVKGTWCNDS